MEEDNYDVAIIGAGIIGLCTAYHLVNNGLKTIVFEQFPVPHNRGSSHGHSRIIRYAYKEMFYCNMMQEAYKMWQDLEQIYGYPLLLQNGLLEIGNKNSSTLAVIEKNLQELGVPYERMNGTEINTRFPMFRKKSNCEGILDKSGGILLADKCIRALLQCILRSGGSLRDQVEVLAIETRFVNGVVLTTTDGVFRARKVVITAGAWTKQILTGLHCQIPLEPIKTSVIYWRETQQNLHQLENMPAFIDKTLDSHIYGLPSYEYPGLIKPIKTTVAYWKELKHGLHKFEAMPCFIDFTNGSNKDIFGIPSYEFPGRVKVCLHSGPPTDPDTRDRTDDSESIETVRAFINDSLPSLDASKPCITESCMYTKTPDCHFVIDKHPRWDHVIIGAGMSGHGFKLSIVVGEMLANMAQEKPSNFDLQPFRIDRFDMGNKSML